jgi:glycosyltransferase involved in cell wall biosynthesis
MEIGVSTSVIQRGQTGVAQHLLALVRTLARCAPQHRFSLFVLEEDLPLFDFVSDTMRLVTVSERFRSPVRNILWHQVVLPRLVRRLNLDVLHIPSYRRLLWSKPCFRIGTIHDLAPLRVRNKYDWKRFLYCRRIVPGLVRRQDRIIAVSQHTARDIARFTALAPEAITVIPNGIDHDRFFPGDRQAARSRVATRFGLVRPFFLYIARLEHPAKNHVGLIDAFERFKSKTGSGWQLVLGGADWGGAETIHRAMASSPFASDIHHLGFIPDRFLPDLYRAAGILVYPSLFEGFGLPPLEAMACGCPVIASARGALGEVLGASAAIIEPEDIGSIAGQMELLAGDEMSRARLVQAGLAQARKFDWGAAAAATLAVYEQSRPCVCTSSVPAKATPS